MKIILEQADLDKAVRAHVTALGMNLEGKDVSVDFTAGRGANGNTATVEIQPLVNATQEGEVAESTDIVEETTSVEPNDDEVVFD